MDEPAKPRFVVSIDFGTSGSGYAFATVAGNDVKIEEFNNFEIDGNKGDKVCTCVVLSHYEGQFALRKFGNFAAKLLSDITPDTKDICGFKYFKMNLFDEKTTVESPNNFAIPVIDLIQHTLEYIVAQAYNRISKAGMNKLKYEEIQWVITVPAIWTEVAKHVMRVAAEKASIPKTSLILALEPEAAALCCRKNRTLLEFEPGTKYMVVDCGGGTIDIAVHEIDDAGFTHSLAAPIGGPWGSTKIDENFYKLLVEIVGDEEIKENPDTLFEIMNAFEKEKKDFLGVNGVKISLFSLRPSDTNKYHSKSEPIAFHKSFLILSSDVMKSFYTEPIESIVSCMDALLKRLNCTMKYILLVGGFSQSLILQDRITKAFQSATTKVVTPTNPQTVVLEGGVHFGVNPKVISSRYSSLTYGIKSNQIFVDGVHPPEYRFVSSSNVVMCSNVLDKFVSAHQKIPLNYKVTKYFRPLVVSGETLEIKLIVYTTPDENAQYITKDMKEMGTLVMEVPGGESLDTYNIEVTMEFGGTEIKVTAKHRVTKKEVEHRWKFQTDYISASLMLPKLQNQQK